MQKAFLVLSVGLLVFSISCDNPTESKHNPYEQHAIAWPSLADSPWPICRHDPQNTGRSPYPGAFSGVIVNKIPSHNSQASTVVGADSTIFFYTAISGGPFLYATDFSGNLKWSKQVEHEPSTTPVVLYDGSIVTIGLETGEFIRLTTTGDTLWQCFIDVQERFPWAVNPGITVGLDTTIYFAIPATIQRNPSTICWKVVSIGHPFVIARGRSGAEIRNTLSEVPTPDRQNAIRPSFIEILPDISTPVL